VSHTQTDTATPSTPTPPASPQAAESERKPCSPPANFRKEIERYDQNAKVSVWEGPRYRMTVRQRGEGPPLIVSPGLASTYRGFALTLNKLADRYRTIIYGYPGDEPSDRARLGRIKHEHLVDDLFGLIDHLNLGRVFLLGISFGSTITLRALHREPRRFPKAVIQGGFAHRQFTPAERVALAIGRHLPGTAARLPMHESILRYNNHSHFPNIIADRWPIYVEQNGLTPIAALSHRLGMLTKLDLRPILKDIPNEILLIQGNEDRIIPRSCFEELRSNLPKAEGMIVPIMGHQPHFTQAEVLAHLVDQFLLPCVPEGCPNHHEGEEHVPHACRNDGGKSATATGD
jgi:pimeloyl-ACP methyl ester carboxylesterase